MDTRPSIGPGMTGHRQLAALLAGVVLASPAAAREKVVRMTLGPFRIEANRDREVCQAVRVPSVPGMEITSWEVRSRTSRGGKVGSHHMVVYGYRGADAAAFPHARSRRDVVDIPGCNGFGPADFFRTRVQLAGSGGENSRGNWLVTRGTTPLGLATLLPNSTDAPHDAVVVLNSHYFNGSPKPARGLVRVILHLAPYDGKNRVVRNVVAIYASHDIDVPPGAVGVVSATWQADGTPDEASEGGMKPDHDVCVLYLTTHTHKRGTHFTITYEEDGKGPVTLLDPASYDYLHPPLVALPVSGPLPDGNLLRAYTAENGHPRLRYTCTHANGTLGLPEKTGCEEEAGITPGAKWGDRASYSPARPCGQDGVNCAGFGTGRCVDANLVFGPLSDDDMCIVPAAIYDPTPGAPPETACDPYAF